MGYACPVCDVPQQDGEHLADHMAFTAMTYGDEHESWLDEHVPDWSSSGTAELAPRVTEVAEEASYETVFEDTVHDHAGAHEHDSLFDDEATAGGNGVNAADARERGSGALDAEAQAVLEEAQEMTREMLDSEEEGDADSDDGESEDDESDGTGS